jgi:hypothetical protein
MLTEDKTFRVQTLQPNLIDSDRRIRRYRLVVVQIQEGAVWTPGCQLRGPSCQCRRTGITFGSLWLFCNGTSYINALRLPEQPDILGYSIVELQVEMQETVRQDPALSVPLCCRCLFCQERRGVVMSLLPGLRARV